MHPYLLVELRENQLSNMISIVLIYLLNQTKRLRKNNITMVKPVAGSHGMAMLYLATPSMQPLCNGLVKGAVKRFY
jgi:hypothetical protein